MTRFSHETSFPTVRPRGLFACLILVGANLRAPITSLGPVLGDIQAELHLGAALAGALNALPLFVFAVLSLVAPLAGRRYGLERVLGFAVAAIAMGTLARSLPGPGVVWLGTLVLSAGIAFGNVLLPGLVKRDFPMRTPMLIGLYAAAMAGTAGLAAGLAIPIAHMPGSNWRWSIGAWAVLALLTLFAWTPHMKGSEPRHADAQMRALTTLARSPWGHAIGWQVSLFFAAHSLVFYALVDWYATYATSQGISAATAGVHLLVYQVIAVAANLSCVPLIKRLPDQRAVGFVCGTTLVVGVTGLLLAPSFALLWLAFAGIGAGIAMVTSPSLFALRTRDHHQASSLSSMAQFVGYMGRRRAHCWWGSSATSQRTGRHPCFSSSAPVQLSHCSRPWPDDLARSADRSLGSRSRPPPPSRSLAFATPIDVRSKPLPGMMSDPNLPAPMPPPGLVAGGEVVALRHKDLY